MIPLKLILEGIYSYQERQTIDFTALTDVGLFGIFGSVGSGKSSILEAITYALYGETERLNARDKRAYNMMNLKSNRSYIELDFINFEDRTFKITREFKRNSKNFEDVKSPNVVLYERLNEQWIPLESSHAQQIVGLSYENFKRTIIIPQGQFKEFIELGAKERTDMMKEIFQLHRFDLQDKVSTLYKKNQSALDQLNGQLVGFEEITGDLIEKTNIELQTERQAYDTFEASHKLLQEQFQSLKKLKDDFNELEKLKSSFQQLAAQKVEKESLRLRLIRFEDAQNNFMHILKTKEKLDQDKIYEENRRHKEQIKYEEIQELLKNCSAQLEKRRIQYNLLPQRRIQELDLELITQLITFSEEIKSLQERAQNGRRVVEETKELQKYHKVKAQETEAKLLKLKQAKPSASELMELGRWYTKQQTIQQQESDLGKQLAELDYAISDQNKVLQNEGIDIGGYQSNHQAEIHALEEKLHRLREEKAHLLLQQKLTEFADNLVDGSPCPLCGAIEHPTIVKGHDITHEIMANDKLINDTNELVRYKIDQKFRIESLAIRLQSLTDQRQDLEAKIVSHKDLQASHFDQFVWQNYDSKNESGYIRKKQELSSIESQIGEAEQKLANDLGILSSIEEKLEKYNKALNQFELEEAGKQAQINQNTLNLRQLSWSDYQYRAHEEIEREYRNLKIDNLQVEKDYVTLTEQINDLNNQSAAQNSLIQAIIGQLEKIVDESLTLNKNIEQQLHASVFETLDEVKQTLAENLQVQQIRQELEQFQVQFETLKAQIAQLDKKLQNQVHDDAVFTKHELYLVESSAHLKELTENVARLTQELDRLKAAYAQKENLLQLHLKLSLRNDNLKQLFNLFKAAGFVQYVSSIYLRQLCDHANIRFHRMTRNQLSLQINDNNDFEIIDYLNEGKSRSVKTLSGGQSFQVSLSLALALAESVQSNTKATKNFFFIDEGFGTQDLASVNIVFETLLDLRKENRIVGIISHVEELKERIPISLSIEKDEERGSQIFSN